MARRDGHESDCDARVLEALLPQSFERRECALGEANMIYASFILVPIGGYVAFKLINFVCSKLEST